MTEEDTPVSRDGHGADRPMSYQYLVGSTVDYEESLMGSKFVITNPNATTTCGWAFFYYQRFCLTNSLRETFWALVQVLI